MSLEQSGSLVAGTILSGILRLRDAPLDGEIDQLDRFVWTTAEGCVQYRGALTLSADGLTLSGSITADRTNCDPAEVNNGTMTLEKM